MANQEVRVKLTNTQLNILKFVAKNKDRKNVQDEKLPHELFVTTRQTTKIRTALANTIKT